MTGLFAPHYLLFYAACAVIGFAFGLVMTFMFIHFMKD